MRFEQIAAVACLFGCAAAAHAQEGQTKDNGERLPAGAFARLATGEHPGLAPRWPSLRTETACSLQVSSGCFFTRSMD
jgi:hypothetical protein